MDRQMLRSKMMRRHNATIDLEMMSGVRLGMKNVTKQPTPIGINIEATQKTNIVSKITSPVGMSSEMMSNEVN